MFDFLHDIGSHEESYSIRISPLLTWPTAVAGEADSVSSVSASACQIGGLNFVNPDQIVLVYDNSCYCLRQFDSVLSVSYR